MILYCIVMCMYSCMYHILLYANRIPINNMMLYNAIANHSMLC